MTSTKTPTRPTGRTRIITAASIGAVCLAGLFAAGANLGILTGTDQSNLGKVSAAGDLIPADTRVVDVYLDEPGAAPTSTTSAPAGSQRFAVDEAGTVDVSADAGRARLDLISPARGWTAEPVETSGADVGVSFTDGTRTLEFTASAAADGTVTGDVTESANAAVSSRSTPRYETDDDDGYEYEGGDSDD